MSGARSTLARIGAAATGAARPWLKSGRWSRAELATLVESGRRRPLHAVGLAAVLIVVVGLAAWAITGRGPSVAAVEAREGPFRVSIVETGTLEALRSVTYASRIQSNQAKIVALAPEGDLVEKGDLLILFDAAPFEEEIRRNQALLAQAQADLLKAGEDLKLQAIQNTEELQAARLRVEESDLELQDVRKGKGQLKEEEAAAAVAAAARGLQEAEGQLEDLQPLLAEGFITRTELERAEQQRDQAAEELILARRRRDALLNFGRPLELSQARSEAQASQETLRQLQSANSYRLAQKEAAIAAARSRIDEASAKVELAKQQLGRCEVRADVPGIVVYKEVFFGSERRRPQVGDQVWANQPLLILPDISKMVVETRVRETDIHKVERNQDVKVQINESEPRLRPGMTARVEIEVEERASAVSVPLEAVFDKDGRHVVYPVARRPRPREVVLGPSNADFVVVEEGLAAGERVLLHDPGAAMPDFSGQPGS